MPPRRRRVRVAVALGSNLGRPRAHLRWAVARLAALLEDLSVSAPEWTAPHGVTSRQPDYLNAVAVGWTRLSARELLDALLTLEARRGRTRPSVNAPRTLDLDLVLYDAAVIDEPGLRIPHPRYRQRAFVLGPLASLVPRWRDPETGQSMAAAWRAATARR